MKRKKVTRKNLVNGTGNQRPSVAQKPAWVPEGQEWTWMVDEDPAFYLSAPGSAENGDG